VCLGGGTITTSKAKINVFLKIFLHSGLPFWGPSTQIFFQKMLILALGQTVHCPAKMTFFPHYSSLCDYFLNFSNEACVNSDENDLIKW